MVQHILSTFLIANIVKNLHNVLLCGIFIQKKELPFSLKATPRLVLAANPF